MEMRPILLIAVLAAAAGMTNVRRPDFEAGERIRIQAHFDSVLAELRTRDLSAFTADERDARTRVLRVLAAYRDRGLFPHNYDRPGLVPTFVDPRTGVHCAVAHLVASTGRSDIVKRVAAADNHVYVVELASDTAFRRWLGDNGLTLAEAARIQVPYTMTPRSGAETLVPAALAVGSGTLAIVNLMKSRGGKHRVLSGLGVLGGAMTVLAGSAGDQFERNPRVSAVAIGAGSVSGIVGLSTMFSLGHDDTHAAVASGLTSALVDLGARSSTSKGAAKAAIVGGVVSTAMSAVSFARPRHLRDPFDPGGDTRAQRILIGRLQF